MKAVEISPEERQKLITEARCDSDTILASLGPIAMFARNAESLAEFAAKAQPALELMGVKDDGRELRRWAESLAAARKLIGEAMESMGNYENGADACTDVTIAASTPVFDMHHKRKSGETWEV